MRQTFSLIRLFMATLLIIVGNKAIAQTENQAVTDTLTAETFGIKEAAISAYNTYSYQSSSTSTEYLLYAKYLNAGMMLPLTDKHKGGLVSIASTGAVTKIKVVWNERSMDGDIINIYGKTSAYNSVADLYTSSSDKQGDLLTTCIYSSSSPEKTFVFSGDYKYIGIRPSSTTLVLTSVEITYNGSDTPTDPDPDPETPTQQTQTLSFPAAAYTVTFGESFSAPKVEGAQTTVTYSSSNTDVASIDATEGSVTIIGVGTTTITASAVENESYTAASASYTLTVNEKEVVDDGIINGTYALVAEFQGNHYAMTSEAFTKDVNALAAQSINVVNNKVVSTGENITSIQWNITSKDDNNTYYYIRPTAYPTKYLNGVSDKTNLTIGTSCIWEKDEKHNSWVLKDNTNRTFLYIDDGCFRNYAISNIGNEHLGGYTSPMPIVDGHVREEMEERKLGSICLPYGVKAEDISGAYFYSILGKKVDATTDKPTSLVCYQVTEDLEAGMPYLFLAKSSDPLIMAYSGDSVSEPKNKNGMYGTLGKTTVEEDVYFISDNKLRPCKAGSGIRANRAYIKMSEVPKYEESASHDAKRILEIGDNDSTTSLESIQTERTVDVYSINGVLLRTKVNSANATHGLRPGLYIIDGKKVMVK